MKLQTICITAILAGAVGTAMAAQPVHEMPQVSVTNGSIGVCAPPDGADSRFCAGFERMIEANFTPTQIGMLYGYRTAYPEYLSGGIENLRQRCELLVQGYLAGVGAAPDPDNAAAGCEGSL